EAFKADRWPAFFERAHHILPDDGRMLLHTIVRPSFKEARARGMTLTHEIVHFSQFILTDRSVEVRLQGWEEFDDKVDRIVSIGAFEAFKADRWPAFFERAHHILPDDGRMLLHTILTYQWQQMPALGIKLTMRDVRFARFIGTEIFPGGQLPTQEDIFKFAEPAGFSVEKVQLLQLHYARTLETWAAALEANRDEAIA
ncbi:class I SAM-dependent methyltransferase, partial [Mycobacterium sp. E3298]|uniref:class I SAM-dependent methyltransferase n=1 Tax=Mycobacterium sp. E3298 TaxID=1856865 RepID=UPI001E39B79D